MGSGSVVAAIRALRKSSLIAAFAAAECFYRRTRERAAARLLLELDAERGSRILLSDYSDAPVTVRHQIGRLLRRIAPRTLLLETLDQMSTSAAADERLAAAELAGWLPFEEPIHFLARLVNDDAETVEKAALAALRQRRADEDCAALIASLVKQPRPRQWTWLHVLVQRGDPAHLADPKDPRSIHGLLDQLGDDFREEANTLLEQRSKELEQAADKLERNRHRP
jgi:hypothetical protein